MKKLLVTGGVLFAVMPAMALDLPSDLIAGSASINCSSTQDPEFAVAHDSEHPMDMQALYMTNACSAGQYLVVSGENATFDNDGILENATCTTCPAGSYCEGSGQSGYEIGAQLASSYGIEACPVGYTDGGTNVTSEANCAKTVDATYCASLNLCNNFNNIVTTGNNACTTSVNTNNSNIVNGLITYGSGNTEPLCVVNKTCQPGYTTTNMYAWLTEHPESVSGTISYCSPNGINDDGEPIEDCSTNEAGTLTWTLANAPIDKIHFITACSNRSVDPSDLSTMIVDATTAENEGLDRESTGAGCWVRNIDLPGQPWFFFDVYISGAEGCARYCGNMWSTSASYLFGSEWPTTGAYAAVPYLLSGLASATNGQNGNPSADVCIASTVNINWADVQDAGDAATCTYGEGFTAPAAPTPEAGYKFLGWKVTSTNNND